MSESELNANKKLNMVERIQEYNCMNKYFATEEVIGKDDSYGVSESDGDFFGQMTDGLKQGIGKYC